MSNLLRLWDSTGLAHFQPGQVVMILIGLCLLFLAIRKQFEPLLLVPIGFGGVLANIPGAGLAYSAAENALHSADPAVLAELARLLGLSVASDAEVLLQALGLATAPVQQATASAAAAAGFSDGMLYTFYTVAIASGVAPLVIFMGVGAMTDFGPLLANPRTLFLGAAAQFGIFATVLGAVGLSTLGLMDFRDRKSVV